MATVALREQLQTTLQAFEHGSLKENALALLDQLGYRSDKQLDLEPNTAATFLDTFGHGPDHLEFKPEKALVDEWLSVDFLFQLAGDDLAIGGQLPLMQSNAVDTSAAAWQSYLFFAIGLRERERPYTRTELANITREVNKLFLMPVMLIFQHGQTITLSVINRRLNKRYPERDVLEKVTLVKDINVARPHRAHLEILADLASTELHRVYRFTTFEELYRSWQKALDSSELNKRFFQEVSNWYFWALEHVQFPDNDQMEEQKRNEVNLIRLVTRLIFVWFLKEKGLVRDELFNQRELKQWLKTLDKNESSYYRAILQNLFFATLNQEMGKRNFRNKTKSKGRDQNYMVTNLYRYEDYFKDSAPVMSLFESIPFLNGGLFECLDRRAEQDDGTTVDIRVDGFSDNPRFSAVVPNELFFADEHDPDVDLNEVYGIHNRRFKVRGILEIFNSYKFTVTENTPIEEEIALDPELLGKVFENLLAAYNKETRTTARKQTGSFYTPREIVNYMVDESLVNYLKTQLTPEDTDQAEAEALETKLRQLVDFTTTTNPFADDPATTLQLIVAINSLKVFDPAVGSGAFPMGMLQKLVLVLGKLDPENALWKHEQRERAIRPLLADIQQAQQISYDQARETAIKQLKERLNEIEDDFAKNEMDYPRKLFLIENCIYGVDIQPVAVQIAKLRFFISLVVEQTADDTEENRGIKALPNLETQFVSANILFSVDQPSLKRQEVLEKEEELEKVRRRMFSAKTQRTKYKYRERDKQLRSEISNLLKETGLDIAAADALANWDPYDQNVSESFFDPRWMFGIEEGFDVCIGNPPYVRQEKIKHLKPFLKKEYQCYTGVADLYVYFYERGFQLLKKGGTLAYITSNKWFRAQYGKLLRQHVATNYQIQTITDFGELSVFEAATFPMIFIARKHKAMEQSPIFTQVKNLDPPYPDIRALIQQSGKPLLSSAIKGAEWLLIDADSAAILKRMEASGISLEKYINGQLYRGVLTGFNEAFVIGKQDREQLLLKDPNSAEIINPLAVGDDVRKWHVRDSQKWLIFTRRGINIEQYPAIKEYLEQWKPDLMPRKSGTSKRGRKPGRYKWYEIQDDVAYYQSFGKNKIIYPVIAKEPRFSFDRAGTFTNDKAFIIPVDDLYLLGVLNSKIVWHYLKCICSALGDPDKGGRLELRSIYMNKVPIPHASERIQYAIQTLVSYILCIDPKSLEKSTNILMLNFFEQLIDGFVYELYLPEDLHAHSLTIAASIEAEDLPNLNQTQGNSLGEVQEIFENLYAQDNPLRHALLQLYTIPIIRFIEGNKL
jgi:adenine-specific DNA-methyltransferase